MDMPELAELVLHEQGEHGWYLGTSEDRSVWDTVAPPDTQNA